MVPGLWANGLSHFVGSALSSLNRWKGRHRAAFWRELGFPNLVLVRAAWAGRRKDRQLEEWKQEEVRRMRFATLDEPAELAQVKGPRQGR